MLFYHKNVKNKIPFHTIKIKAISSVLGEVELAVDEVKMSNLLSWLQVRHKLLNLRLIVLSRLNVPLFI